MRTRLAGCLILFLVAACGSTVTPGTASPGAPTARETPSPVLSEVPGASAAVTPSPARSVPPSATPTPRPSPTPIATPEPVGLCQASQLSARVTGWEGAAGSQIATVRVTNASPTACILRGTPEVQLVAANGAVLIDSAADDPNGLPRIEPGAPAFELGPGDSLPTLVRVANYCGADPPLPTTVAFVLPADTGPGGDVPPCNGPGTPGLAEMNGWGN
jgi:hypothetical protein